MLEVNFAGHPITGIVIDELTRSVALRILGTAGIRVPYKIQLSG
jgi:hypothetical protein